MKQIIFQPEFERNAKRLPEHIKRLLKELLVFFQQDPFHPRLHSKPLKESWSGCFSFRVTRNYRVIFKPSSDMITVYTIDHRKDAYR